MELHVPDMSCGHCKAAIQSAIAAADPAADLAFDLPARRVTATTTLPPATVQQILASAGYDSELLTG